jgi:hypothetical protein
MHVCLQFDGIIYWLKEKKEFGDLNFLYHLKQEFGLNPQVLVMPTCLLCLLDGGGSANREKRSMLHLATGFTIVIPYII